VTVKAFERPQLFHLSIEMIINRRFIVFWRWSCREVLLYFERTLEKILETISVLQNVLKKHCLGSLGMHSRINNITFICKVTLLSQAVFYDEPVFRLNSSES